MHSAQSAHCCLREPEGKTWKFKRSELWSVKSGVIFEIFSFALCSKEAHALMTSSFRSHKDLQDHGTKPPCFVARCDLLNSKTFYSFPWYVYYANRFEICPKYLYFVIAAFLLYHVVN